MSTNFDFLYKPAHSKITQKNIHDICFVHGNSDTKSKKLKLSSDSVRATIFDFTEIPFSWGKISGDILWASPYSAEFISMPEYKFGKCCYVYSRFCHTRGFRTWDNYDEDGIPLVAFSDWDAYTQLENPSFTAQRCSFFKLTADSKILIINSFDDYKDAMNAFGYEEVCIGSPVNPETFTSKSPVLKFENIAKNYDGIYVAANLTDSNGVSEEEKVSILKALSIWDVDSLVIWNNVVDSMANLSANTVRRKISSYYLGKNKKAITKGIRYETVWDMPNVKISENNYSETEYGLLLGVDKKEKAVYFEKYMRIYKIKLHDSKGYEIVTLDNEFDWDNFSKENTEILASSYIEDLIIKFDSLVEFKALNQAVAYPAAVCWADDEWIAIFFMDQFNNTHCVLNNELLEAMSDEE